MMTRKLFNFTGAVISSSWNAATARNRISFRGKKLAGPCYRLVNSDKRSSLSSAITANDSGAARATPAGNEAPGVRD